MAKLWPLNQLCKVGYGAKSLFNLSATLHVLLMANYFLYTLIWTWVCKFTSYWASYNDFLFSVALWHSFAGRLFFNQRRFALNVFGDAWSTPQIGNDYWTGVDPLMVCWSCPTRTWVIHWDSQCCVQCITLLPRSTYMQPTTLAGWSTMHFICRLELCMHKQSHNILIFIPMW